MAKPYKPDPAAPYGKVCVAENGRQLRAATREEWFAHRRHLFAHRDGTWEEDGRDVYINGPDLDPAIPPELALLGLLPRIPY